MKKFNYYKAELKRLNLNEKYPITIQLSDGCGNKTKTLSLNSDSIKELKKFLNNAKVLKQ